MHSISPKIKVIPKALVFACAFTTFTTQTHAVSGLLVPDEGIFFSIGQDVDSINQYINTVGVQPGGVTNYVGIVNLDGLEGDADAGAGRNNITELASTYPDSALVIGVSMNGQVDNVAAGMYNNNIDYLLNKLGQYNRPVYLRWAYEVDGPWNGHNQADLITSFRHVHQRIRDLGYNDRIALVWQVASYCPSQPGLLNSWWPGDDYVDWVGLSYFSPQDCNWERVNEAAEFARSHNKPLFINESTPQRYQIGDLNYSTDPAQGSNRISKTAQQIWNEWYGNYFGFINNYSDVVKAITYINADWDQQTRWGDFGDGYNEGYWGDSRVQANSLILQNWLDETGKDKYIKLSSDLFAKLNFGDTTSNSDDDSDTSNTDDTTGSDDNSTSPQDDTGSNDSTPNDQNSDFYVTKVDSSTAVYSFLNKPSWPAQGTFYNCKDGDMDCYQGALVNGRWEYTHHNLVVGQQYKAMLKVPGMGAHEFPAYQFTWQDSGGETETPADNSSNTDTNNQDNQTSDGSNSSDQSTNNTDQTGDTSQNDTSGEEHGFVRVSATSATYWFKHDPSWPEQGHYYNCKDGGQVDCFPAVFNNGRWEYTHQNLVSGQTYEALLKVPGMSNLEFPKFNLTW